MLTFSFFLSFLAGLFQTLPSLWHSHGESSAETTSRFRGLAGSALPSLCVCCCCCRRPAKRHSDRPSRALGRRRRRKRRDSNQHRQGVEGQGRRHWAPWVTAGFSAPSPSAFPPTLTLRALLSQPLPSPEAWILQTTCVVN